MGDQWTNLSVFPWKVSDREGNVKLSPEPGEGGKGEADQVVNRSGPYVFSQKEGSVQTWTSKAGEGLPIEPGLIFIPLKFPQISTC